MPYFKPTKQEEQVIYSDTYNKTLKFIKVKKFIKQEIRNRKDVSFIDDKIDKFVLRDLKNKLYIVVQRGLIEILDNYDISGEIPSISVLEYYRVNEDDLKGEILNILEMIKES